MKRWSLFALLTAHFALADEGGLKVESRRPDPDGPWEFLVSAHSDATPRTLASTVWTYDPEGVEGRMVKRRWVLEESATEKLVFSLLDTPLGKRATLVRWKLVTLENGAVAVRYASEEGRAPGDDATRITVRGEWVFSIDEHGGTSLEHRQMADPHAPVPHWLVRGPQQDAVVRLVREALERARR
ncbi:MAG: hypothetical protein U0228_38770 [Myxococcaceae bacterium]